MTIALSPKDYARLKKNIPRLWDEITYIYPALHISGEISQGSNSCSQIHFLPIINLTHPVGLKERLPLAASCPLRDQILPVSFS